MKQWLSQCRLTAYINEDINIPQHNKQCIKNAIQLFKQSGNAANFNKEYLVGFIMLSCKGQLNPKMVDEIIKEEKVFE